MEGGVTPGETSEDLMVGDAPAVQQVWRFGPKDGGRNLVSAAIKTKVKYRGARM